MAHNVNMTTRDDGEAKMPKLAFKTLLDAANIAEKLPQAYLDTLGLAVVEGYRTDRGTRKEWEEKNAEGIKLALQVSESKSFPWAGCSNIKFPLVTIACLQFLARVSILTKGRQIAKCDVLGLDPTGQEGKRAGRIGSHLSYQLLEEDDAWLDDDEKAKFAASIVGCAFKKTFFDPVAGVNQSDHVPAAMLVVDYFTKDIDKANRITHELVMSQNDLKERQRRGVFLEVEVDRQLVPASNELEQVSDEIQGITAPGDNTLLMTRILEQHLWLDLDGDGYQEPYIAFVTAETGQVLRLVARFYDKGDVIRVNDTLIRRLEDDMTKAEELPEQQVKYKAEIKKLREAANNHILRIEPLRYFTKIPFIPAPDGGFYDLGLGALLGPTNAAVDTLINQLIDNGTMQTTAGGFLGRGVKMKGGTQGFSPFEWKPVDSNGDDLRKNIVPLPVQQPSNVLFQLLGMLVNYGERISGSTDIMSGVSPGQNTPAETSRNTVEQGMMIFSGIYQRMHRAFRRELQKYVALNELFLEDSVDFYNLVNGEGAMIARDDYVKGKFSVRPSADPATASATQRQQKAMMLRDAAMSTSGYNRYEVEKNFLEAYDVPNIDTIYPDPSGPMAMPPPVDAKMELEMKKLELAHAKMQGEMQVAIANLQVQAALNAAKITELEAKATYELAQAEGVDIGHQLAAINAQIGAAKTHQDGLLGALSLMQTAIKAKEKEDSHDNSKASAASSKT
jgi:chaperonin GroES